MSGTNYIAFYKKQCVEDFCRLSIPELRRKGMFKIGRIKDYALTFTENGSIVGSFCLRVNLSYLEEKPYLQIVGNILGRQVNQTIYLTKRPMPRGGFKWYGQCPISNNLFSQLVFIPEHSMFISRKATKLPNRSVFKNKCERSLDTLFKAQEKLHALPSNAPPKAERLAEEQLERAKVRVMNYCGFSPDY